MTVAVTLRHLIEAHLEHDEDRFRTAAMQAVAGLRSEADRLRLLRMLEHRSATPIEMFGKEAATLVVALPSRSLDSVVIPAAVAEEVALLAQERECAPQLMAHGLAPRSRVLLYGPPGCGKTSLAAALATATRLNGFSLRIATARRSYMGQTSGLLHQVFDVPRNPACLLLLDELDAIAEIREHASGAGAEREHTAIVATMLQLLDQPLPGMVVATTNRSDMIDPSVLRRFDVSLELPAPDAAALTSFARSLFERYRHDPIPCRGLDTAVTYADAERLVTAAIRRMVCARSSSARRSETGEGTR